MSSDNNKNVLHLIRLIGQTPGFRLANADSGNFKAIRNATTIDGHPIDEATKKISIRTQNGASYENLVHDLRRKLGWTQELHDDLEAIASTHRSAGTDPTADINARLLDAFAPDRDTQPEPEETPAQKLERIRHARTTGGLGSAKPRKAPTVGATSAPPQVLDVSSSMRPEYIAPERALDLLCTIADYQRKLKVSKVEDYSDAMARGEWVLLPSDPICIDTNGRLCNGQHRLEAVVKCEQGQPFWVAYDVDPATYDRMDRGVRRNTADMLYGEARAGGTLRKDVPATSLAALLRMLHVWDNYPQEEWYHHHRSVSEQQIRATLADHPKAEESVAHGRLNKLKIKPSAAMFAHYLIARACDYDYTILNPWYEELRTPRRIRPGDPAFALREYYLGGDMARTLNRKKLPREFDVVIMQAYLILRAWENTCLGKPMQRMSPKPPFVIPDIAARPTNRMSYPS